MPEMDLEIGHVNLMVKSEKETQAELEEIDRERQSFADDEGIAGCPWEDDKPVVGWHTDSYPFVCVLMLSDCSSMIGGETALQTGRGDILKIRGPEMVCAGENTFQPQLTQMPGLRSRSSRSIHHSPSPQSIGCQGANHNGHVVPAQVTISRRRYCLDDCPTHIGFVSSLLRVWRISTRHA